MNIHFGCAPRARAVASRRRAGAPPGYGGRGPSVLCLLAGLLAGGEGAAAAETAPAAPLARAAAGPALKWGTGIYIDQDLLVPQFNQDRDYTMGIGVEAFWERKPGAGVPGQFDKLLGWVDTFMPWNLESTRIQRSLMFGTVNFTPDDLGRSDPIFDDRPYASLLYLSTKRVPGSGGGLRRAAPGSVPRQ